jgi:acylphosphatase
MLGLASGLNRRKITMMNTRVHIQVHGRVQGVCFRLYAQEKAEALGLTGWICNNDDGSVETIAEGAEADVKEFVTWHHQGPPQARVDSVEVRYSRATGEFRRFTAL